MRVGRSIQPDLFHRPALIRLNRKGDITVGRAFPREPGRVGEGELALEVLLKPQGSRQAGIVGMPVVEVR